ncbi:hypothetical protein PMI15_01410 [Polaromonas sp. CF318]|nr:hypothetical protein PMI15_01410 [Polaromonas sp. CF318]
MATPMRSLAKLALGVSLLSAGVCSFSGTAGGQFGVQIHLNGGDPATNACTSATGSGSGGASVQVSCNSNVFVNIVQVRNASALANSRFMPGYRPTRDSLLPDYCRSEASRNDPGSRMACRLDDQRQASAGDEADDGWEFESRRYAMGPEATEIEKQARLRFQDVRGTLTAVRLAHAGNQPKSIEMLVSF